MIASEASPSASAVLLSVEPEPTEAAMSAPVANPIEATPLPSSVREPFPREVHVPESRLVEARPAESTQIESRPVEAPREVRTLEARPAELRTVQRPAIPPEARYAGSDTLPDDDRIPR